MPEMSEYKVDYNNASFGPTSNNFNYPKDSITSDIVRYKKFKNKGAKHQRAEWQIEDLNETLQKLARDKIQGVNLGKKRGYRNNMRVGTDAPINKRGMVVIDAYKQMNQGGQAFYSPEQFPISQRTNPTKSNQNSKSLPVKN